VELNSRMLSAALALAATAAVAAPVAGAATPKKAAATTTTKAAATTTTAAKSAPSLKLTAKAGDATFTAGYVETKDGGKISWKLDAPKLGKASVAVKLLVPYNGKPVELTLCGACRSTENGQAVVALQLAKVIAAGKASVEVQPDKGKLEKGELKP
jgi:hypothetical protein